jgi:hypothetical protein
MPEKGWSIITIRDSTKKRLLDMSKKEGKSVNEIIMNMLNYESRVIFTSQTTRYEESKLKNEKKLTSQDIEYED